MRQDESCSPLLLLTYGQTLSNHRAFRGKDVANTRRKDERVSDTVFLLAKREGVNHVHY
jgi:hypothetical protein